MAHRFTSASRTEFPVIDPRTCDLRSQRMQLVTNFPGRIQTRVNMRCTIVVGYWRTLFARLSANCGWRCANARELIGRLAIWPCSGGRRVPTPFSTDRPGDFPGER